MNPKPVKKSNRSAMNGVRNLLLMPGLGSLMAGRWVEGIGQVALAIVGSGLMFLWLYKVLQQYYGQMFEDVKPQSVGSIGAIGGVLLAVSWVWALVTSLSLFREAAREAETDARTPLRASQVPPVLPPLLPASTTTTVTASGWQRNGQVISRVYQFTDFPAAMEFVNAVARLAEEVQHHPDIDIRWNKVTLALTTHDAGGLTEKDFALARQCDALIPQ